MRDSVSFRQLFKFKKICNFFLFSSKFSENLNLQYKIKNKNLRNQPFFFFKNCKMFFFFFKNCRKSWDCFNKNCGEYSNYYNCRNFWTRWRTFGNFCLSWDALFEVLSNALFQMYGASVTVILKNVTYIMHLDIFFKTKYWLLKLQLTS